MSSLHEESLSLHICTDGYFIFIFEVIGSFTSTFISSILLELEQHVCKMSVMVPNLVYLVCFHFSEGPELFWRTSAERTHVSLQIRLRSRFTGRFLSLAIVSCRLGLTNLISESNHNWNLQWLQIWSQSQTISANDWRSMQDRSITSSSIHMLVTLTTILPWWISTFP